MSPICVEALLPTPVLNIPHFSSVFGGEKKDHLLLDEKGHMRSLEFVALPGTLFKALKELPNFILQVTIPSYNCKNDFFIDSRFTQPCSYKKEIPSPFPTKEVVLSRLKKLLGVAYVWGGNYSPGIPELLSFYPPSKELDLKTKNHWMLKGSDCSGILYEVTEGKTPRNTSQLMHFGEPLLIEGLSHQKILSLLRPLDLLVYLGHVIIVFDSFFTIESREALGVVQTPVEKRLSELLKTRIPRNVWPKQPNKPSFVIRRWMQ